MFNFSRNKKTQTPTAAMIEGWKKLYGSKLYHLELDGKVGYARHPTKKEVVIITMKLIRKDKLPNSDKWFKQIAELCWLGGDKEILNNPKFLELWQTS